MQDAKLSLWDIHTYLTRVCSHNFPKSINFTPGLLSLAAEWCHRNHFSLSAKTIPWIQSTCNSQQNTEPQFTTSHETIPIQHLQVLHTCSHYVFAAVTNVWQNPCPVKWESNLVPNGSYTEVPPWRRYVIDATSSPWGPLEHLFIVFLFFQDKCNSWRTNLLTSIRYSKSKYANLAFLSSETQELLHGGGLWSMQPLYPEAFEIFFFVFLVR